MTPAERLELANEILKRGEKYLPLLEEARARGEAPPAPEGEDDEATKDATNERRTRVGRRHGPGR
jgi:hypothetical protein